MLDFRKQRCRSTLAEVFSKAKKRTSLPTCYTQYKAIYAIAVLDYTAENWLSTVTVMTICVSVSVIAFCSRLEVDGDVVMSCGGHNLKVSGSCPTLNFEVHSLR